MYRRTVLAAAAVVATVVMISVKKRRQRASDGTGHERKQLRKMRSSPPAPASPQSSPCPTPASTLSRPAPLNRRASTSILIRPAAAAPTAAATAPGKAGPPALNGLKRRASVVAVAEPSPAVDTEPRNRQRTGILVHGCHLEAEDWEGIVWGHAGHGEEGWKMGRLPAAVLLAAEESAALLVLGTGASKAPDGRLEGRFTLDTLLERLDRLHDFPPLRRWGLVELATMVRKISVAETDSTNTTSEVRAAFSLFQQHKVSRGFLVSSPTHLPRCLACACEAHEQLDDADGDGAFHGAVYASPSETCYESYHASDVVVVEPPHRGDRNKELDEFPFHSQVRRSFKIRPDQKKDFLRQFEGLLAEYGV